VASRRKKRARQGGLLDRGGPGAGGRDTCGDVRLRGVIDAREPSLGQTLLITFLVAATRTSGAVVVIAGTA
jgi:hypothetical protein